MPGDPSDNRKYKRLDTNWVVRLRRVAATESTRRRLDDRIKNISEGGVFIEAAYPFALGEIIEFDFSLPGSKGMIHVRGVVRWSNDGRIPGAPVGMGVEFLEVHSKNRSTILAFVDKEVALREIAPLRKSKLHENLLRLYCRKIGQSYTVENLAEFLGCKDSRMLEILDDFLKLGMAKSRRDEVTFVPAPDEQVARGIIRWYEGLDQKARVAGGAPGEEEEEEEEEKKPTKTGGK